VPDKSGFGLWIGVGTTAGTEVSSDLKSLPETLRCGPRREEPPIIHGGTQLPLKRFRAPIAENKMRGFIKRFLMHYGIYRRYPLRRFPALRNAWRATQP
jgi:hypothetical protein